MRIVEMRFEEVSIKGVKRWTDADGKRRQKTKVFMQTINPFNTDADGRPKDRQQILAALKVERDAWLQEPTN